LRGRNRVSVARAFLVLLILAVVKMRDFVRRSKQLTEMKLLLRLSSKVTVAVRSDSLYSMNE